MIERLTTVVLWAAIGCTVVTALRALLACWMMATGNKLERWSKERWLDLGEAAALAIALWVTWWVLGGGR